LIILKWNDILINSNNNILINNKDILVLIKEIDRFIFEDYEKIKRLMEYLKTVVTMCFSLNIPIVWDLPSGLTVQQSYLQTKSTLTPFLFSKAKINIQVTDKTKYDKNRNNLCSFKFTVCIPFIHKIAKLLFLLLFKWNIIK